MMKLGLSKRGDKRGQHLVLVMDIFEQFTAHEIIKDQILHGRLAVKEWDDEEFVWRYRFAKRYLDVLMLAFPMADLSPGIRRRLRTLNDREMKKLPAPHYDIEGFFDYIEGKPAKLLRHQRVNVNQILEHLKRDGWFMLNDEMGLGKTLVALVVMMILQPWPAIVYAPNNGKWAWQRIIERFLKGQIDYVVTDGTKAQRKRQLAEKHDLTIVNFEMGRVNEEWIPARQEYQINDVAYPELYFRKRHGEVVERKWKLAVVDEHHRVKTPEAQITRGFLHLAASKLLLMSGTPILNRVEEIWTALHKTNPERFPTLYAFMQEFCIMAGDVVAYRPEKMLELRAYLREHSIRWRADQVMDRPPVVTNTIFIELTAEQKRLYNEIVEEMTLWLEDGSKKKIFSVLARTTRLKQACFSPELYGGSKESAKIAELRDNVIPELIASGEKALLFSQWSTATRILEREFEKYNPAYVDGSVKGRKRMDQEDKFNHDPSAKLYIGTIGANREAISLPAATYVIFTDEEWSPMALDQARDRSAAGGLRGMHLPPGKKVNVIRLHARNTVEDFIEDLLLRKRGTINAFVERDAGRAIPRITVDDIRSIIRKVS